MSVEVVTVEDLESFRSRLLADLVQLLKRPEPMQPLMTSGDVRKLLKISPGTLQQLRVKGMLPYIRLEGAFRYRRMDIERLIGLTDSR